MPVNNNANKKLINNHINHIVFLLDMSSSMHSVTRDLIRSVDAEIAYLAQRSQALNQETRITIYLFNYEVTCLVYDKDVLRLPSIADYYQPFGMTALLDATSKAIDDLEKTPQLYGDHAFLIYAFTDGQENHSLRTTREGISQRLTQLPDNWTLACFVPNQRAAFDAKQFGFPAQNIATWDATTRDGIEETFSVTMRNATETYMDLRSKGVRGSKTILAGGTAAINTKNVRTSAGMRRLPKDAYQLFDIKENAWISIFVEQQTGAQYVKGSAYYQLMKPEKIQPQKKICVRNRRSGRVYTGDHARQLLNLPDHEVRVKPEENAEFQIFVQSTSVNRKLIAGTKLLLIKDINNI